MKKTFLFLMAVCLFTTASSISSADLLFKMTANKTTLTIGETATIELFAFANDALAAGQNGLNNWQLSMLVSGSGTVEILNGSIVLFAPFAYDSMTNLGINNPAGSLKDLQLNPLLPPQNSELGVGQYSKIAEFVIQGASEGEVQYQIGNSGGGFNGILRDYNPMNPMTWGNYIDGTFNAADSTTVFTVVPEPTTLALLGGMSLVWLRSRKSGRL